MYLFITRQRHNTDYKVGPKCFTVRIFSFIKTFLRVDLAPMQYKVKVLRRASFTSAPVTSHTCFTAYGFTNRTAVELIETSRSPPLNTPVLGTFENFLKLESPTFQTAPEHSIWHQICLSKTINSFINRVYSRLHEESLWMTGPWQKWWDGCTKREGWPC